MAWAAIAAYAAGTIIKAYGQYQAGAAAKKAAYYEADALEYNAQVAELEAELALEKAEAQETLVRQEGQRVRGQQRVMVGYSGAVSDIGSAFDVLAETARKVEQDASMIRYHGALEAWRSRVRAWEYRTVADLRRYEGRQAKFAGKVSMWATLLTGAGTATYAGSQMGAAQGVSGGGAAGGEAGAGAGGSAGAGGGGGG